MEESLIGQAASPALLEAITPQALSEVLSPIDDVRASASYRLAAASETLRRALAACLEAGQ